MTTKGGEPEEPRATDEPKYSNFSNTSFPAYGELRVRKDWEHGPGTQPKKA